MTLPDRFWWGAGMEVAAGAGPTSDVEAGQGARRDHERTPDLARDVAGLEQRAELGLGHVRLTLDWSRLEPEAGRRDDAATEHLREVLGTARRLGLSTWACLHDRALPGWFSVDEHGFGDDRARRYFWARHVEQVGEELGDLVDGWVPTFEPNRWALRGWLTGSGPPGNRDDAEGFSGALQGVLLASVEAAQTLRGSGAPVATAHWIAPAFAARVTPDVPPSPDAEAMTSVVDEALYGCWRRLLTEDVLVVPGRSPIDVPGARAAFDVIGFTYRHAVAVRGDGALLPYPQQLATGPDGQVAWSEGLALATHHVAETFPERPLLLAGFGTSTADGSERDEYVHDALVTIDGALDDGIDLRGAWWNGPGLVADDGSVPASTERLRRRLADDR